MRLVLNHVYTRLGIYAMKIFLPFFIHSKILTFLCKSRLNKVSKN